MSDRGIPTNRKKLAVPVSAIDDETRKRIHRLADGTFRPIADDLRVRMIQEVAEIDQDHIKRGLYNTTIRLNWRKDAELTFLRATLDARVRSIVEAFETAGAQLDDRATTEGLVEIERICSDTRRQFLEALENQQSDSLFRGALKGQLIMAYGRDVARECYRASEQLRTELARHELIAAKEARGELAGSSMEKLTGHSSGARPGDDLSPPVGKVKEAAAPLNVDARREVQTVASGGAPAPGKVSVVDVTSSLIRISAVVPGRGPVNVEIRGPALTQYFRVVRRLSSESAARGLIEWTRVEGAMAAEREFKGALLRPSTFRDYGTRIQRLLHDGGLSHLWQQDAGAGVRWYERLS